MKKILIIITVISCYFSSNAQDKQAAIWYFGNHAGLDFSNGAPVALTDGQLNTIEGCSTISDTNGALLFYTDGISVWTNTHQVMPNGVNLGGHPSSTQSGIIVPWPNNPDLFYIFTTDNKGGANGMQYNIVDMSLNGGLGDVSSSNNILQLNMTEKLTAVAHANGTDIWVVAHRLNSNEYVSYQITPAGLNTTPVLTPIGLNYSGGGNAIGYMKASPNGAYVAIVGSGTAKAEVLEFNANSGVLSNPIDLSSYPQFTQVNLINLYGVEFSPNSEVLYISNAINGIHQFNLANYTATAVLNSGTQVGTIGAALEIGGMQLAIDGKIYVTQAATNYLGAINSPNTIGLGCNYVENVISLGSGMSNIGLPPFIQSYFVLGFTTDNLCAGSNTQFNLNATETLSNISWNFGDGTTSSLENPTHTYVAAGTYTVHVSATSTSQTKTETKEITIYEVPIANIVSDFEVCTTPNNFEFDLTTKDDEIRGAQLLPETTVAYYPSLIDAQDNTNKLPDLYTNSLANEIIFARIYNANNTSCYSVTSFDLILQKAPIVNTVEDVTVCDTDMDGFYTFDLSDKTTQILENNDPATFNVSYYLSQTALDNRTDAINLNFTNTTPRTEIFWRIENNTYTGCYGEGTFFLEVIAGVTANAPTDFEVCDDNNDGIFEFDLSSKETEILGTQNAASTSISFHKFLVDAQNGNNPVDKNSYTNSTPYNETLFVRVENNADASCYDTNSLVLKITDSPMQQIVTNWLVCDDDADGVYNFDLIEKNSEILGNQLASAYRVGYYQFLEDAIAGDNEIIGEFRNNSNPQSIFYRVENISNTDCFITGNFELEVFNMPTATKPMAIAICDTDESGVYNFDLSPNDAQILNGQDPNTYEVLYYATEADANNNENLLSKTSFINSDYEETIYARVQNSKLNTCFALTNFQLSIRALPQPNLEVQYVICPDSPDLTIDGGEFETWVWRRSADGQEISTDRILYVADLGDYSLTVSHSTSGLTCEKTVAFEVVSSGAPEDFTTTLSGFSDVITIEVAVTGTGDFEYAIEDENYQDSNRLEVFPGEHTVYVRDKYLCRTISKEVFALGYQKFFTPNGDGTHENWHIIGIENYPNAQLYIFDRYGKMLTQLAPNSKGWDGTFQGVPMPSADYWFRFINEDGSVHTGHFTLKR